MTIMTEKEAAEKKHAVMQSCKLLFPNYKMIITPRGVVFMEEGKTETINIDENNFEYLQEAISEICCLKNGKNGSQSFNPGNKKA